MKLSYRPAAKVDIHETREWYRKQSPALEGRFAAAVADTIQSILEHPRAYQLVEPDVRRAGLNVFPYLVYYAVENDAVVVLAVLHGKRHPDTWKR